MGRPGLLCTAGTREQDPALQPKVWVNTHGPCMFTPDSELTLPQELGTSFLFGTFENSQDLEAT